jgi:hypothetical protein
MQRAWLAMQLAGASGMRDGHVQPGPSTLDRDGASLPEAERTGPQIGSSGT